MIHICLEEKANLLHYCRYFVIYLATAFKNVKIYKRNKNNLLFSVRSVTFKNTVNKIALHGRMKIVFFDYSYFMASLMRLLGQSCIKIFERTEHLNPINFVNNPL